MHHAVRMMYLAASAMLALTLVSCSPAESFLDSLAARYDKPLVWMNASHQGNGSKVEVGYRLPPPPDGKVYVVWALTRDHSRTQKLAVLTDGSPNGRLEGATNFRVEGIMISVEDSHNVTKIGDNRGIVDVGMR